jgi:hypothetical protein
VGESHARRWTATTVAEMNDGLLISPSRSIGSASRDRVAALASARQRRPIIVVLGMHRSGTSLCSHILSALGGDMTDNIPGPGNASLTPDNPRGHWERWEIVEFHDRILGLFDRGYWGPFHDFPLPVAWWADPRVVQIRREMIGFLEKRMTVDYFGFKDPRTVRLLPVWHQIFNELKLTPKIVLCLRNPAHVARSLYARDGLDPAIGEYRWLVHTIDLFRYASSLEMCTVEYEGWFGEPTVNLEKLRDFLGLPWQQSESELGLMLSGIIDSTARHDDHELREASQPLVRSLYKLVRRAGKDREAHDQIAYIASQFVGFQQLQRPFQQAFEDIAKTAAKIPELKQELDALRATAGERDVLVEAQRSQLEDLAKEREARVAAADAMQGEIAVLRETLERTEQEVRQREAAAAAVTAELAVVRGALAQAEDAAQENRTAAETAQAEAEILREALARSELLSSDRATACTTIQSEVSALRDRLAQVEGEAAEGSAASKAFRAEIEALQDKLIAARQVGKVAMAALQISGEELPQPDPQQRRWRHVLARIFGTVKEYHSGRPDMVLQSDRG